MGDVDMLLENNIILDKQIYDLWLQGYSAAEAADVMKEQKFDLNFEVSLDILLSEVHDHFRLYTMMEPLMKHPLRMKDEMLFQLSPVVKGVLIERYYGFDADVMREILNKKISSRSRSSLDDVSEKTKVFLRSCRRQFDNLKRVFKVVEDLNGNLVENIKLNFLLSADLAQKYAAIIFIAYNRFDIGRKKLAFMTFDSFLRCATVVIDNWSYSCKGVGVPMGSEESSADLQKDFVCALREVKSLSDRDNLDEHKILVMRYLQGRVPSSVHIEIEDNFRALAKALINIAGGLNQSKELRDFFYDLAEKFVEQCKQLELSQREVTDFLVVYRETSSRLDFFVRQHSSLLPAWDTYLTTVSKCVDIMYS